MTKISTSISKTPLHLEMMDICDVGGSFYPLLEGKPSGATDLFTENFLNLVLKVSYQPSDPGRSAPVPGAQNRLTYSRLFACSPDYSVHHHELHWASEATRISVINGRE